MVNGVAELLLAAPPQTGVVMYHSRTGWPSASSCSRSRAGQGSESRSFGRTPWYRIFPGPTSWPRISEAEAWASHFRPRRFTVSASSAASRMASSPSEWATASNPGIQSSRPLRISVARPPPETSRASGANSRASRQKVSCQRRVVIIPEIPMRSGWPNLARWRANRSRASSGSSMRPFGKDLRSAAASRMR